MSVSVIARGDLKPRLEITIGDAAGIADFGAITAADVRIVAEQDGVVIVDSAPNSITPSTDGHSATVIRQWQAGETDAIGRMWISVVVKWPDAAYPQTFPDDGPLRLDVRRNAGDL